MTNNNGTLISLLGLRGKGKKKSYWSPVGFGTGEGLLSRSYSQEEWCPKRWYPRREGAGKKYLDLPLLFSIPLLGHWLDEPMGCQKAIEARRSTLQVSVDQDRIGLKINRSEANQSTSMEAVRCQNYVYCLTEC